MTRGAGAPRVETYPAQARLGPEWDGLFAAGPGLQSSRAWFAATEAGALPAGALPCYVGVRDADGPALLVPMLAGPGRGWSSLTTPYTCLYQPLPRPGLGAGPLRAAAAAFGRYARRHRLARFDALDPDWPGLAAWRDGLAAAGLRSRAFAQFGNWHVSIPQGGWAAYLRARPGTLRETIRRKTRLAARDQEIRLELVADQADLPRALEAYEAVHARSWKQQEPHPGFNRALVRALGPTGSLRFGLLWQRDRPIAAQYWTVAGGVATVLKLAHDEHCKPLSPGTLLTADVIRRLIEAEGIGGLDFGRGDDEYKQGWTGQRRVRIGLIAADPWSPAGLRVLARHDAGRLVRAMRHVLGRGGGGSASMAATADMLPPQSVVNQ